MCHLSRSDETGQALAVSLTHVHVPRSMPLARAVADHQKHRVKKLRELQLNRQRFTLTISPFGCGKLPTAERFRCCGTRGEAMAPSSLQPNDGARHATAERLKQIPRRPRTKRNSDRRDRNGPVELAGRRYCAGNRTPAFEEARSLTAMRYCSFFIVGGRKPSRLDARSSGLPSPMKPVAMASGWRAGCAHTWSKAHGHTHD